MVQVLSKTTQNNSFPQKNSIQFKKIYFKIIACKTLWIGFQGDGLKAFKIFHMHSRYHEDLQELAHQR